MDEWDADDYERRQAALEFVGPDEDLIERQQGDRGEEPWLAIAAADDLTDRPVPGPPTIVLQYPAVCASCHQRMLVGDEAVVQRADGRWQKWHPEHESPTSDPKAGGADLEPGERLFPLMYPQACGRCGAAIAVGDEVAGRKLDRGWAVRHPACRPVAADQPARRPVGSGG